MVFGCGKHRDPVETNFRRVSERKKKLFSEKLLSRRGHQNVATLITRNINVSNLYFVLTYNMSFKTTEIYIWFGFLFLDFRKPKTIF